MSAQRNRLVVKRRGDRGLLVARFRAGEPIAGEDGVSHSRHDRAAGPAIRQARARQDARVERIAEGFDWSEGPVWDKRARCLLFSDVPMNTVFQWQEGKG